MFYKKQTVAEITARELVKRGMTQIRYSDYGLTTFIYKECVRIGIVRKGKIRSCDISNVVLSGLENSDAFYKHLDSEGKRVFTMKMKGIYSSMPFFIS